MHARAFDQLAAEYDATFTESTIGKTLRALVWSRLGHAAQRCSRPAALSDHYIVETASLLRGALMGLQVVGADRAGVRR